MITEEIKTRIIEGAAECEAAVAYVMDDDGAEGVPVDELWQRSHREYMQKSWDKYLDAWFVENEDLVKVALGAYEADAYLDAWSFGMDIAHTVLGTGVLFIDRPFLSRELALSLEDSLEEYWTVDNLHEFWITKSGTLECERWIYSTV